MDNAVFDYALVEVCETVGDGMWLSILIAFKMHWNYYSSARELNGFVPLLRQNIVQKVCNHKSVIVKLSFWKRS